MSSYIRSKLIYNISRHGNSTQPIWSKNMNSTSSHSCYATGNTCPSSTITSCSHSEDVTVTCSKISLYSFLYFICIVAYSTSYTKSYATRTTCEHAFYQPVGNGVVRLFRNGVTLSSFYYGIIQIYINNQWGNICDDSSYDQLEANVICHQLGYTGASSYFRAGQTRLIDIANPIKLIIV